MSVGIDYQETSRLAWQQFAPISPKLDEMIMAALRAAGPAGLTCEAIEQAIGRSHQAVSGNLRHLVEKAHVEKTGQRGLTISGRSAFKWTLTPTV